MGEGKEGEREEGKGRGKRREGGSGRAGERGRQEERRTGDTAACRLSDLFNDCEL